MDQYSDGLMNDGSSVILTSAIKKMDLVTFQIIEKFLNDDFPGGLFLQMSAAQGSVGIPNRNPNLTSFSKEAVKETLSKLEKSQIKVPSTYDNLILFLEKYNYITTENVKY